jgi:multidrug efflux pump subunit AcrB
MSSPPCARQHVQVAAGAIGQPPRANAAAPSSSRQAQGRLTSPSSSTSIVSAPTPMAARPRRDVARVEIGAQDYGINAAISTTAKRSASASSSVRARTRWPPPNPHPATMEEAARTSRRASNTRSSTTRRSSSPESVSAVQQTLLEAIVLVVIVVIVFLQTWRAAIIPIIAIPVSLVGTFAGAERGSAISSTTISLFGLVLAIGIVVDDAIVVVENVERNLAQGMSAKDARTRPWTRSAAP